ncbi:hypothetical protein C8A03DRAFT_15324 [Achaetomium macrosporum]|uniref:Uncharacterized protein n=1 Tax=Achaetomium macrosporum TaxID=79813 RepID=A0AAN7CA31_9PEZI|nr:hypothetical protein C8A03DRAFT_15324 [Achaetomium macrosporum]
MARPFTYSSTPAAAPSEAKPLPEPDVVEEPKRPGTSGTEAALKITRRRASQKLRQAERAERLYRAKKRSAATRANYADAKDHLRQAKEHFKLGFKLLVAVVKGVPYVLREKHEVKRLKKEEEKRKKVMEMKQRLDEKLAGAEGNGDEDQPESEERVGAGAAKGSR